eukprot:TRINITY_DN2733_c0_g1_i1.p1 TRINITY_DN2733_c0_g1~~TRINITY_DN2733_c0_g1_i1.p1  ORF type:complete len:596 (+),score=127.33 TRINITY_DN2733_c0_g1_i1:105-1892(+)
MTAAAWAELPSAGVALQQQQQQCGAPALVHVADWPTLAPQPPDDSSSEAEGAAVTGTVDFSRALGESAGDVELGDDEGESAPAASGACADCGQGPPPLLHCGPDGDSQLASPSHRPQPAAVAALQHLSVAEVLDLLAETRGHRAVAQEAGQWAAAHAGGGGVLLRAAAAQRAEPSPVCSLLRQRAGSVQTPESAQTASPSPGFDHQGRRYPPGLNRRQRRAIMYGTPEERARLSCPEGEPHAADTPASAGAASAPVPRSPAAPAAGGTPSPPDAAPLQPLQHVSSARGLGTPQLAAGVGSPPGPASAVSPDRRSTSCSERRSPSVAFEHQGKRYPPGLNRRQRRAIMYGTPEERARLNCPDGTPAGQRPLMQGLGGMSDGSLCFLHTVPAAGQLFADPTGCSPSLFPTPQCGSPAVCTSQVSVPGSTLSASLTSTNHAGVSSASSMFHSSSASPCVPPPTTVPSTEDGAVDGLVSAAGVRHRENSLCIDDLGGGCGPRCGGSGSDVAESVHSRQRFARPALDRHAVGVHQSVLDNTDDAPPPPPPPLPACPGTVCILPAGCVQGRWGHQAAAMQPPRRPPQGGSAPHGARESGRS